MDFSICLLAILSCPSNWYENFGEVIFIYENYSLSVFNEDVLDV